MAPQPTDTLQSEPPIDARRDATFLTTRWTQVRRAQADSPDGRRALADLCAAYYGPVTTFLRYELRDRAGDAARDVAHDFFAQILSGASLFNAVKERGRFRSYLLGALKHYLSHRREAANRLKRVGGAATEMKKHELPERVQAWYNFDMKTERPKRTVTTKLLRMSDPEAQFDPPVPGTMAERIGLVWDLTAEMASLGGKLDAEQRLHRHVTRLLRV